MIEEKITAHFANSHTARDDVHTVLGGAHIPTWPDRSSGDLVVALLTGLAHPTTHIHLYSSSTALPDHWHRLAARTAPSVPT